MNNTIKELTPLMKQYYEIKSKYSDAILFFRLGDFYEMFNDDAIIASKILSIALTTRDKNKKDPVPMCGIPHFASASYIKKLIDAGQKVAVCEQIEDPSEAKGIVKRAVVRVVTPGTFESYNPKENLHILSIRPYNDFHGIAVADISTGNFFVYETPEALIDEISRFEPKEILCREAVRNNIYYSERLRDYLTSYYEDYYFDYTDAYRYLLEFFKVSTLEGYGCDNMPAAIEAAGGLLHYLSETQKEALSFNRISVLNTSSYMFLDSIAKRNLELLNNLKNSFKEESLLWIMDETLTPMGGRFLRDSILKPLIIKKDINERLNYVEELYNDFELLANLRIHLKTVQDLERLTSRLLRDSSNARDLIAIKTSIDGINNVKVILYRSRHNNLETLSNNISYFNEIANIINNSIIESPPNTIRDGGIIKAGFNKEIDELRDISAKGKMYLSDIESKERERTGINSLKISYNKVFGYYIEVTKSNLHLVPDYYIRKQTLANSERFIIQELKDYENKILGSEERLKELELHVFKEITEKIKKYCNELLDTTSTISFLDFLQSLSTIAKKYNYVRPLIDEDQEINIVDGRHPVLERALVEEKFIPNDIYMNGLDDRLLIITGPNMAGKSTYMRQVALTVIMAQIGSFVPAQSVKIGIVDRIFTRIGASDYLSKGQSTFMVEMIETANIVNNSSDRSLIILDEIGRGTSTFDGISIAWAVAEYIANELKVRTLFATHYHELTELSLTAKGVKNYNIAVKEWGDEIIFLRKIEKGPADKSYGIQVGRLAGLPEKIINRAHEVINNLEKEELNEAGKPKFAARKRKKRAEQLDLFAGKS